MLVGRGTELNYLNNFYEKSGSQIVVVYGQRGIGKTSLLKDFIQERPAFFYECRECSEREQLYQWGQDLGSLGVRVLRYPAITEVLNASIIETSQKQILVIDEFQYMVKTSALFMNALVSFVNNQYANRELLVVLTCSSPSWIENNMVERIGEAAFELSGLLKIKPLNFEMLSMAFPNYTMFDRIQIYSILGGIPGLWKCFSDKESLQKNICNHLISQHGVLQYECRRLLSEELRELNVYNTILSALSSGAVKLNDLHEHTGFSRAKISVYLKNLMALELVEKVFSYDTAGRDNVQKGVYRISNPLIHFYFTYLYSNMSALQTEKPEIFYSKYVKSNLRFYTAPYFKEVCTEFLIKKAENNTLPIAVTHYGEWVGKSGNIDVIMQDAMEHSLVVYSNWEKPMLTYDDYEWLLYLVDQAKISADYVWLFSGGRFDEKLYLEEKVKGNLKLITLQDMK